MLFTILTAITIIFERLAGIEWIRSKKDYENKPIHEVIYMIIEIVLLIPTPNSFMNSSATLSVSSIDGSIINFNVEELLAAYVTIRSVYYIRFLIHF